MRIFIIGLISTLLVLSTSPGLDFATAAPRYQQCAQVVITSPQAGTEVRGTVTVEGSASMGEFQFYKVEFSTADQPNFWRAVSQTYSQPVINGILDIWNTPALPDGQYSLKVTTVDVRGQEVCRSIVQNLRIANTQPTVTPTEDVPPTLPVPTATVTPAATATPARPTLTPTIEAIIPTREPAFPEVDIIRDTVSSAFDTQRLRQLVLLGAGTTAVVFAFIGLISLLRRLI